MNTPGTVYITGGMSGLGRALAGVYLERGADVAVFDLVVEAEVVAALEGHKRETAQKLQAFQADVSDFEALERAVDEAATALGDPDLAINCAGLQRAAPFQELSVADFEQVVLVNVCGSRNFAAAVLPRMSRGSRLALVASMAGFVANYSYAGYCASKFGVVGLGKVLRLEYKPKGIDVSIICPPEVDTPMVTAEMENMHPASRKLKDLAGSLSLEEAIDGIMSGLDAGREVIIPGFKAKLTYYVGRYVPDFIMNFLVDRIVHSELRKLAYRAGAGGGR